MLSNTFLTLRNERDPKTILESVMDLIVQSEKAYSIEEHLLLRFAKSTNSVGRYWGVSQGELDEIRLQYDKDMPGFHLVFKHDEYGRGSYLGSSSYTQFIPDSLLQSYERWRLVDDGWAADPVSGKPILSYQQWTEALNAYTLERIFILRRDHRLAQEELEKQQAAIDATAEADERALYAKLREKYGDDA